MDNNIVNGLSFNWVSNACKTTENRNIESFRLLFFVFDFSNFLFATLKVFFFIFHSFQQQNISFWPEVLCVTNTCTQTFLSYLFIFSNKRIRWFSHCCTGAIWNLTSHFIVLFWWSLHLEWEIYLENVRRHRNKNDHKTIISDNTSMYSGISLQQCNDIDIFRCIFQSQGCQITEQLQINVFRVFCMCPSSVWRKMYDQILWLILISFISKYIDCVDDNLRVRACVRGIMYESMDYEYMRKSLSSHFSMNQAVSSAYTVYTTSTQRVKMANRSVHLLDGIASYTI